MAEKPAFSERVIVENRRGCYEVNYNIIIQVFYGLLQMRIRNLGGLRHQDCIQTNVFKIGLYDWKVLVFRCRKGPQPDRFAVQLLSCNAGPLIADVCLTIVHKIQDKSIVSGYRSLNTKPFGFAGFAANVAYETLLDPSAGFLLDGELTVMVDIWNVQSNGLRTKRTPGHLINWEGISRESIEDRLASGRLLGIASGTRRRTAIGFSEERIRDFVKERPNFRYWLCGRSHDGELVIQKCLDEFEMSTVFADISEHDNGDLDWVTVFKEKRTESIDLRLPENWIVVFCKRYDMEQQELWYLDHLFAKETDLCEHLRSRIIHLAQVSRIAGDLFVEDKNCVRRIDNLKGTLAESEIHSGSVAVIEVRPTGRNNTGNVQISIEAFYTTAEEGLDLTDDDDIEDRPDDAPSDICVICLDAERTAGFLHGTSVHKCVCKKCGEKIMKRTNPRCPICRQPTKQLITNVYSP